MSSNPTNEQGGQIEVCPQCGVPATASSTLNWEPSGVISLADSPHNRMIFFESDDIDLGLIGIEELIGIPIERLVIESRARETRRYIERMFHMPKEMQESLASIGKRGKAGAGEEADLREKQLESVKTLVRSMIKISTVYGCGRMTPSDAWETDEFPWRVQNTRDPYSLLFAVADILGAAEDAIYDDLEAELGDEVPAAIIESQRRYIKTVWGADWNKAGATVQETIALRGFGNLVDFADDGDLKITIRL